MQALVRVNVLNFLVQFSHSIDSFLFYFRLLRRVAMVVRVSFLIVFVFAFKSVYVFFLVLKYFGRLFCY